MAKDLKWFSGFFGKMNRTLDSNRKGYDGKRLNRDRGFDVSLLYDIPALLEIPSKARIISLQDKNGYTLLHHAADLDCAEALELLLSEKGMAVL